MEGPTRISRGCLLTNVNRKKKTVEVTVDLQGKRVIMWLGYELVEPVPDRSERVSKEK